MVDVVEACARWRDGAALWRFESNVVERVEMKVKVKVKVKVGCDRFEVVLDVIEIVCVDEGVGYGELVVIRIYSTMVGECAFVFTYGEVVMMMVDGVKCVLWWLLGSEMIVVGDWYGFGYGVYLCMLLYGSYVGSIGISSVYEVDLRSCWGEMWCVYEVDCGEMFCVIFIVFEYYYVVVMCGLMLELLNVELRDVRRANDFVFRWDY